MIKPDMDKFDYDHLPPNLQAVSIQLHNLAHDMENNLPDNVEKDWGLRKLLEAKDCFVRAAIPKKEKKL